MGNGALQRKTYQTGTNASAGASVDTMIDTVDAEPCAMHASKNSKVSSKIRSIAAFNSNRKRSMTGRNLGNISLMSPTSPYQQSRSKFGPNIRSLSAKLTFLKHGISATSLSQKSISDEESLLDDLIDKLIAAAVLIEPPVTEFLKCIAGDFGGKMEGLEYKFKSKVSLVRKVHKMLEELYFKKLEDNEDNLAVNPAEVIWSLWDSLRYTIILPTENYTQGVKITTTRLEEDLDVDHLWRSNCWPGGDGYQGINDTYVVPCQLVPATVKTPGKLQFELQFHTPESFAFKMHSHTLYEVYRAAKDPVAKAVAFEEQVNLANQIPVPAGVLELPTHSVMVMPCELAMYADLALSRAMALRDTAQRAVDRCLGKQFKRSWSILLAHSEIENCLMRLTSELKAKEPHATQSTSLRKIAGCLPNVLTVVITAPDESYAVDTAFAIDKLLKSKTIDVIEMFNGWNHGMDMRQLPRWSYVYGFYARCSIVCKDDGGDNTDDSKVEFTIAFHTPSSYEAELIMRKVWHTLGIQVYEGSSFRKFFAARIEVETTVSRPTGVFALQHDKSILLRRSTYAA